MSKVIKHSRIRRFREKAGSSVRTKPHNHLTDKKLCVQPRGTNYAINIKIAKRG